jgi:hypothetical protein
MVSELEELVLVISGCFSMVSVAFSIILSLRQYRLKLREEERLAFSSRADIDVRLIKAFTELMDIATGRGQHVLSEKAVEELFKLGAISKEDFNEELDKTQKGSIKLSEYSVIRLGVGRSGQEAAIAAIATLASTYPVLKDAAMQGLENIQSHNEIAKKYLAKFNEAPLYSSPH